ncbi:hypothetical protein VP01_15628g1, partial [Puccinia sorghi]
GISKPSFYGKNQLSPDSNSILNTSIFLINLPNLNPAGYCSNVTDGQNRQTSRVTTPVKGPSMIQPSTDSRRSISQPVNIIKKNPPQKQKN